MAKLAVNDSDIYRFLTDYYFHQDKLLWSRTQTIVAVEAGVLAAAFTTSCWLASMVLLLGIVFIAAIYGLCNRDMEIRDQYLITHFDPTHQPHDIKVTLPPKGCWSLRGGQTLAALVLIVIIINLVALVFFALRAFGLCTAALHLSHSC